MIVDSITLDHLYNMLLNRQKKWMEIMSEAVQELEPHTGKEP